MSLASEEKKDCDPSSNDPEAIARRLRDKIRLQAESLLRQCDEQPRSVRESREGSERSESPSITETTESSAANNGGVIVETTAAAATTSSPTSAASPRPPSAQSSSSDLTKRLQQLAVNRRLTVNNSLRVIQADPNQAHLAAAKTFPELHLPEHLLKAVYGMGFDRPSQIQEAALPRILKGRNLIGQAQSGSGKTAAFTLGMLYHTVVDSNSNNNITTQAVCVCPTRELAIQIVEQAVQPMACHMPGFKVGLAIAGGEYEPSHVVVGVSQSCICLLLLCWNRVLL